jgi:hypothetical protein
MWSLKIYEEMKLLAFRVSDTLTLDELTEILNAIYLENDGKFVSFNRFTDASNLKKMQIDMDLVNSNIKNYRRHYKPANIVKVVIFIPQKYIKGFSYLYKSMLSDDMFSIEISDSLDECASHLSVDKKLLEDAVK